CLSYELNDDVKALIGMMDNDVLLPDRGEAVPAIVPNPFRKTRIVGSKDKIGTLVDDQLLGVVETEDPVGRKDIARGDVEPFHQEAAQIGRHRRVDGEMDRVTPATPF